MLEGEYWANEVRPILQKYHHEPRRIESSASSGVPDVSIGVKDYGYVWAELKIMRGKRITFKKYQYAHLVKSVKLGLGALNFICIKGCGVINTVRFYHHHEIVKRDGTNVAVTLDSDWLAFMELDKWSRDLYTVFTLPSKHSRINND